MWISYNSVVSSSHNIFVLCGRYGMFVLWNLLQLQNLGIQLEQPVGAFLIHTFMACVQNMHPAPFSLGLLLSVHPLSHVYIHRNVAEQVHVTVLVGWHLHIPYPVYMCMYGLTGCDV